MPAGHPSATGEPRRVRTATGAELRTSAPTVGPYTLLRVLGEGGTGGVHLARTDKGARVVVRVIPPEFAADPGFRDRLREEIERAGSLRSPLIAPVLDADVDGDIAWVASEYVAAPSLREVVEGHGPLAVPGVRQLGIGLAEALEEIHGAGLVHRGLDADTVLLTLDGPRVVGVGTGRAAVATVASRAGTLVGAAGYLAPEQVVHGAGDASADVFALGSVLLYAATWRDPFGPGDSAAVLYRVLHSDPDLGGVSPDIAPVLAACLHRDPVRRPDPQSVRDVLAAAQARAVTALAEATDRPPSVPHPSRVRRVASVAAASAVLVGLLGLAVADGAPPRPPPAPSLAPAVR
jgi:eukaryotic-like serine/threonine-protein kinase